VDFGALTSVHYTTQLSVSVDLTGPNLVHGNLPEGIRLIGLSLQTISSIFSRSDGWQLQPIRVKSAAIYGK
jgi:hypothetical protein